jgi:hypothetical protein
MWKTDKQKSKFIGLLQWSIHFPGTFFVIVLSSLALMLIYFRYQSIAEELVSIFPFVKYSYACYQQNVSS